MTIGEQLKKTRLLLGITQEQMAAGIITEAHYSRVERDINEINAASLIKMLNKWHVSLYDFFLPFDIAPIDKEIHSAFINHDMDKLNELSKDQRVDKEYYRFELRLIKAIFEGKTDNLSEEFKQKAKRQFLQVGKINIDFLVQLQFIMPFSNFAEIKPLMDYVLSSSKQMKLHEYYLPYLTSTLVAYLKRCVEEKQSDEAKKVSDFIIEVADTTSTVIYKILALYYQALIAGDEGKAREIKYILQLTGYANYLN